MLHFQAVAWSDFIAKQAWFVAAAAGLAYPTRRPRVPRYMVLETEKTPEKPLHRIAERYRPTLTFSHQRSHPLPPGTYAHAVFEPQLASAYSDFASALLQPTHWRQQMFAKWLSNSTVASRAAEVGAIKLLQTHFIQLPPGSWSRVRQSSAASLCARRR